MFLTTTNTKYAQGTLGIQYTKYIQLRDLCEKLCALCGRMFLSTKNTKDAQETQRFQIIKLIPLRDPSEKTLFPLW